MATHELTANPPKHSEPQARSGKGTSAAAGGVEIAGFPQVLYTRTAGDPDFLFVALLDSAREALQMVDRLSSHGESRPSALRMAGMHLASALLRDSSFSLVARGSPHENTYTVDLDAGTIVVHTRLYAMVSRRTSFFKIELAGKIAEATFVVRNPTQGTVITQVEEEKLRRPCFFAQSLAQDCLRAQMEQERFGRLDESVGQEAYREVRLVITVNAIKIPVFLRQKEADGRWDIIDGRRQEWVGSLNPDAERPLLQVIRFLQDLFAHK